MSAGNTTQPSWVMNTHFNGNETISFSSSLGGLTLGDNVAPLTVNGNGTAGDFYPMYQHYYPIYYPSYTYVSSPSSIEKAFKVVEKLIINKMVKKEITVKEFLKLVNEIAEVL